MPPAHDSEIGEACAPNKPNWSIIAAETGDPEPHGLRMSPTHLLTAEFSVLTNTSAQGRSDTYLCAYELVDLESGRMVWQDSWEVKRAVSGRTYD